MTRLMIHYDQTKLFLQHAFLNVLHSRAYVFLMILFLPHTAKVFIVFHINSLEEAVLLIYISSRKHAYIILTPFNPTLI